MDLSCARPLPALLLVLGLAACAGAPDAEVVHVVRPGENLYRLSRYYGVTVDAIRHANRIRDLQAISVGARLRIPNARRPPARRSLAPNAPPAVSVRPPPAHELGLGWPIHGRLSSTFGWRGGRPHEGIDIAARSGTRVIAAAPGRVIKAGWLGGYGRVVIVKHRGAFSTLYAHNRRNHVRKGQFVERGDVIAEVGSTGNASGPHLHFELRRGERPLDPLRYLPR